MIVLACIAESSVLLWVFVVWLLDRGTRIRQARQIEGMHRVISDLKDDNRAWEKSSITLEQKLVESAEKYQSGMAAHEQSLADLKAQFEAKNTSAVRPRTITQARREAETRLSQGVV